MIIKRTGNLEMRSMKRCKMERQGYDDCGEEEIFYDYEGNPKRLKSNGYYSYGEFDDFSSGSGYWSSEESYWAVEFESNSMNLNKAKQNKKSSKRNFKPPLLKSSRGRTQTLPSRFNDAVLDSWKSRKLRVDYADSSLEDDEFDGSRYLKDKYGYGSSDLYLISKRREERGMSCVGINNSYEYGSYLDSSSSTLLETEETVPYNSFKGIERLKKERGGKRKDVYKPEDFALGDLVWAKCGKRYPTWPAIVIDPILQAPESVLSCCVPGAICVMFFGYSKNGTQRDYAWVKQGMIFPFAEFMDRYQGQTQLFKWKQSDFQMALEEAVLAENGFLDSEHKTQQMGYTDTQPSCSSQDLDCLYTHNQDARPCDSCGSVVPLKTMKKVTLHLFSFLSLSSMASHENITVITSPKGNNSEAAASAAANSPKGGQCLCSPTTHQGSFRCRFHRSSSSSWMMKRSKSMPTNNTSMVSLSPKSVETT